MSLSSVVLHQKIMKDDIDKFIGEWENEAGNLLVIEKKTDLSASVSFFTGSKSEPLARPYCGNLPSIEMDSYLTDYGATLEVELWERGKGLSLHLTCEYAYELDKDRRDSLVAALSRYEEHTFLDQYYHLFEPLKHYTRRDAEPAAAAELSVGTNDEIQRTTHQDSLE